MDLNLTNNHDEILKHLRSLLFYSSLSYYMSCSLKVTEFKTMLQIFDSCIENLKSDKKYESAFYIIRKKEIFIKCCSVENYNNQKDDELKDTRIQLINLRDILLRMYHEESTKRISLEHFTIVEFIAKKEFYKQLNSYLKEGLGSKLLQNLDFSLGIFTSEYLPEGFKILTASLSEQLDVTDDKDIFYGKNLHQTLNGICCENIHDEIVIVNIEDYIPDAQDSKLLCSSFPTTSMHSETYLNSSSGAVSNPNVHYTITQPQATESSSTAREIKAFEKILKEKFFSKPLVEPQLSTASAILQQSYSIQPTNQPLQHSNKKVIILEDIIISNSSQILNYKEHLKCEILKTQRSNDKIVYKGYMYVKHRESSWRCDQRNKRGVNCNVTVKTKIENGSYYIVEGSDKEHSHNPDLTRYEKQKSDGKIKSFAKSIASKGKPSGKIIKAVTQKYSKEVIDKTGLKEKSLKRKIQRVNQKSKGKNMANCFKLEKGRENN